MSDSAFLLPWDLRERRPLRLVKRTAGMLTFSNGVPSGWVFCAVGLLFLLLLPLVRTNVRFAALLVFGFPGALFFLLGPLAAWGTEHLRIDIEKRTYTSHTLRFVTWRTTSGPLTDIASISVSLRLFFLYHRLLPCWTAELRLGSRNITVTTGLPETRAFLSGQAGTAAAGLARREKMEELVRSLAAWSGAPVTSASGGKEQQLNTESGEAAGSPASPPGFPALPPDSRIKVLHDHFLGGAILGTQIVLPPSGSAGRTTVHLARWAAGLIGGAVLLVLALTFPPSYQFPAMLFAAVLLGAAIFGLVLTAIFGSTDESVRSDSKGIFIFHELGEGVLRTLSLRSDRITAVSLRPSTERPARLVIRAGLWRMSIGNGLSNAEFLWLQKAVMYLIGRDAQGGSTVLQ